MVLISIHKKLTLYPMGYILYISNRREVITLHYDGKVKDRVKRLEGQLRGILNMMEQSRNCKDVITQLSAVRSATDRIIGVIVSENLVECVINAEDSSDMNRQIQEAVNLLVKSR